MLLDITDAGRVAETDAIASGTMSPVARVVIGDGVPHADSAAATALVHRVADVPVMLVERISAQAVRFHATIPQGQTIVVRELGLELADGTLYGYLPYQTRVGAPLHKDTHFAFSFALAVSRETLPPIRVDYAPLDSQHIASDIADQTLSIIDDYGARMAQAEVDILNSQTVFDGMISAAEVRALKASLAPLTQMSIVYFDTGEHAGRIAEITETVAGVERVLAFTYDAGRIASVTATLDGISRTETYTYDAETGILTGMETT